MDESRFGWRWYDWVGWALFAGLGVLMLVKSGDWVGFVLSIMIYPVLRALAVDNTRNKRSW